MLCEDRILRDPALLGSAVDSEAGDLRDDGVFRMFPVPCAQCSFAASKVERSISGWTARRLSMLQAR